MSNPENDATHLVFSLKWLVDEVISAGGDDAIWHSRHYSCDNLVDFVGKHSEEINLPEFWKMSKNKNSYCFWWGTGRLINLPLKLARHFY